MGGLDGSHTEELLSIRLSQIQPNRKKFNNSKTMRKNSFFYPVILLLASSAISLVGAFMKLEHTPGASALLWLGLVALVVGFGWFVGVLLNLKKQPRQDS